MKIDCQECDNIVEITQDSNQEQCDKCGNMVFRPTCGWCNSGECPECGTEGKCPYCGGTGYEND